MGKVKTRIVQTMQRDSLGSQPRPQGPPRRGSVCVEEVWGPLTKVPNIMKVDFGRCKKPAKTGGAPGRLKRGTIPGAP